MVPVVNPVLIYEPNEVNSTKVPLLDYKLDRSFKVNFEPYI
jgi:hypothetical protein